jgi:hypothetical protein
MISFYADSKTKEEFTKNIDPDLEECTEFIGNIEEISAKSNNLKKENIKGIEQINKKNNNLSIIKKLGNKISDIFKKDNKITKINNEDLKVKELRKSKSLNNLRDFKF